MNDQMTPAELRAAADEMDEWVNPNNAFDICRDAARRLADVIEYAERERERLLRIPAASMYTQGQYDLHDIILRVGRGGATNHENRNGQ